MPTFTTESSCNKWLPDDNLIFLMLQPRGAAQSGLWKLFPQTLQHSCKVASALIVFSLLANPLFFFSSPHSDPDEAPTFVLCVLWRSYMKFAHSSSEFGPTSGLCPEFLRFKAFVYIHICLGTFSFYLLWSNLHHLCCGSDCDCHIVLLKTWKSKTLGRTVEFYGLFHLLLYNKSKRRMP